jgi:hypothetical protein
MKIKTSELTGPALDLAVSQCMTGGELFQSGRVAHAVILHSVGGTLAPYFVKASGVVRCVFEPSTNWSQGGPIIEREKISTVSDEGDLYWQAVIDCQSGAMLGPNLCGSFWHEGPTPLIAAMRCYVASKLGNEVEIPEELE